MILLLPDVLERFSGELKVYVGKPWNKMKAETLSNIFDTSKELLSYLLNNAEPQEIINNMLYQQARDEGRYMYANSLMHSYFNELVVKKEKINIDTEKPYILVYGEGVFGRLFYELFLDKEKICLFIDSENQASGNKEYPIMKLGDVDLYVEHLGIDRKDILAVITPVWKWDESCNDLNKLGINDCIPLSFILQKSLGIWSRDQIFQP